MMTLMEILSAKGTSVHTITPEATLDDVVQLLVRNNCGSLVVCQHEQMVGIITERDILRVCAAKKGPLDKLRVSDWMSTRVLTGMPSDTVEQAMGQMTVSRVRHLPIVEAGRLVGMVSIGDIVKIKHDELTMENHYLKSYIQS